MNPVLRNALAVIGGLIIGSMANMLMIKIGSNIIAVPDGVDPNDMNSIIDNIHLFEAKHYIFPILAHSSQALVGGFIAAKFGASKFLILAMIVGFVTLLGGLAMIFMMPTPTWVIITDLVLYMPAAWLGWKLAGAKE